MIDACPRVAVAGWIGSTNLGDELIFKAIQHRLEHNGVSCVALSIDPDGTRARHDCDAVAHRGPRDAAALVRELGDVTSLVLGGGGLLQSETSPWNLPFHLSRVWSARLRRIPWAGIGLGVGDIHGRMARGLVRRTLHTSLGITVRDPGSAEALRSIGVHDVIVAADPVLGLDRPGVVKQDRIVVTLRRMNTPGYGTAKAKMTAAVDDAWLTSTAGALDAVAAQTGLEVRLVALQPDRDAALHDAVADRMSSEVSLGESTLETVLPEIAASRIVVAMRYHTAVAALMAGCPTVVVDYSPKMRYLAADVGDGMYLHGSGQLEGRTLIDAVRHAERGAKNLEPALARLRERGARNWHLLDRLLELA